MPETKPLTTANLAGEERPKLGLPPAKPVPSQAKVDDVREGAVAADDAGKKPKDKPVKGGDPYPSQADLDAIKDGTFNRRRRQVQATGESVEYKTR